MTDPISPVRAGFATQRAALDDGQRLIEQGTGLMTQTNELLVPTVRMFGELQRHGIRTGQSMSQMTMDLVETNVPASTGISEMRDTFDDMVDTGLDEHEAQSAVIEEQLADSIETTNAATEDVSEAAREQCRQMIVASEELEAQTVSVLEELFGAADSVENT